MIFSSASNDFLNLKYSDELYHWGIKGQKWGVRRYQNPDGTLTEEGKKRYRQLSNMSNEKMLKSLRKEMRIAKKDVNGFSQQWGWNTPFGKYTEDFNKRQNEAIKEYRSSPEYKEWAKKLKKLENTDYEEDEWDNLMKEAPKPSNVLAEPGAYVYGKGYLESSLPSVKEHTLAVLKDLGYTESISKELIKRMDKIPASRYLD